jgi:hypothetical protein
MLFAECCGSIVVPKADHVPNWCSCGAAACWWLNGRRGRFACYSTLGVKKVSVLGLHNGLLQAPFKTYADSTTEYGCIQRDTIKKLVDETPSGFIFKHIESLIARMRPGFSNDTFFFPHISAMPSENGNYPMLDLTVDVNGTEVKVQANGYTYVVEVMKKALVEAGFDINVINSWQLTNDKGHQLGSLDQLADHAVLGLGQKLFLKPIQH